MGCGNCGNKRRVEQKPNVVIVNRKAQTKIAPKVQTLKHKKIYI